MPSPPTYDFTPDAATIVRITPDSEDLYPLAKELRLEVLLRPVGVTEWFHLDHESVHFVCTGLGRVLGVVLLHNSGKLHQMAVDSDYQGKGVGKLLVAHLEAYAARKGMTSVFCSARHYAVPFYAKLGYEVEGEPFTEVGMEHRTMRKQLSPPAPRPPAPATHVVVAEPTPEAVSAITAVVNQAYAVERYLKTPEVNGGERTGEEEVRSRFEGGEFHCLLPEGETNVTAETLLACVLIVQEDADTTYFGMLSVDPKFQRYGFATRLLQHIINLSRSRGAACIRIVAITTRPELLGFYKNFGFRVTRSIEWPAEDAARVLRPEHVGIVGFVELRYFHAEHAATETA